MTQTSMIDAAKSPCETPGCSANCSFAYSCHEQRMGRSKPAPWPLVALVFVLAAGLLL